MIKQFIISSILALAITSCASAQLVNGPCGKHWFEIESQMMPVKWCVNHRPVFTPKSIDSTTTHWVDIGSFSPQQNAFLQALCMQEQPGASPNKINPSTSNVRGDFKSSTREYQAHGPFQMWKGYIYDCRERCGGFGASFGNSDQETNPNSPANEYYWYLVEDAGEWNDVNAPWHIRQFARWRWWSFNCGLVLNYFDRYCNESYSKTGNQAWEDLNSTNPNITRAAVEELARTHNGGPNANTPGHRQYANTDHYHASVVEKLREHFSGIIAGFDL